MTYHAITVTLENISGIVATKSAHGYTTLGLTFNVTVAGKRHYAVQIRGAPRLDNGMVVTAVLRDPENWQTLVGWLNHASGQICGVKEPVERLALCGFTMLIGVAFSVKAMRPDTSTAQAVVLFLTVLAINAWSLLSWLRTVRVYRLLKR
ncbi:hypothetical protein [Paraburkholderia sp. BCC1886]|uniref:hypothetical protein n=1 Tax=Paraburkholderia sp. BCC1886 TaxID=2562670 RepID=UPI001183BE4D|nr:hypothetical protein [Paraburkholderia sp. BCC1886]